MSQDFSFQHNQLSLKDISFQASLGITKEERSKAQEIFISVQVSFSHTPEAVLKDSLFSDTSSQVCYEDVVTSLGSLIASQSFHLIEHLAYQCYQCLREKWTSKQIRFQVSVQKFPSLHPSPKGGAVYHFGDSF